MSKRREEEDHFGSDSFLDVLANIVGILIILIVSAAARVQRGVETASVDVPDSAVESPVTTPEVADEASPPRETLPEVDEPSPDMAAELLALRKKTAALQAKSEAAALRLKELEAEAAVAADESDKERKIAAEQARKLKHGQLRLARMEEAFGERKGALRALVAEFEDVANSRPPTTEIKHRLAPVSQEVTGAEVFFRVSGGKVSIIPVELLFERVKHQIDRHKDWIATRGRFEGVAGPVNGFSLQFEVERRELTPLDRSRLGLGAYRLGLSHADVVMDADAFEETPTEALKRGSRFAMAVKSAPDRATLTFWVYPDSFREFRILQAACQAEGFVVAARPLPKDRPISFSEDGSRSAAQ